MVFTLFVAVNGEGVDTGCGGGGPSYSGVINVLVEVAIDCWVERYTEPVGAATGAGAGAAAS